MTRLFWAFGFALAFTLSFPFRAGDSEFDVGLVVGWLALVPLARSFQGLPPRAAFRWTLLACTMAFAGTMFWIYWVVAVYSYGPFWLGVAAVLLLAFVLALHVAWVGPLCVWLEPAFGRGAFLVLPIAWVAFEYLRGVFLMGGLPWAFVGYSAHDNGPIRELAAIGGVYGLSFLLVCFASLVHRQRFRAAMTLLAVAHGAGFVHGSMQTTTEPGLRVGIVQASITQDLKWDPERAQENFISHVDLSRLVATQDLDLLLWPEASMPFFIESEKRTPERVMLEELATEFDTPLLIGGIGLKIHDDQDIDYFNSAFLFAPGRGLMDRYDKSQLVPFGEYIPFRRILGRLQGVATGVAIEDIRPGPGPRLLDGVPAIESFAPLICYEAIYPALVRDTVLGGARVLVHITNDAWYGFTSAPAQFLAITKLRAVEHGLPLVRAANTGISAFVDASGRVLRETEIFQRTAVVDRIPGAREGTTLYTRFGDWVVVFCWLSLVVIGGVQIVRSRATRNSRDSRDDRPARDTDRRAAEASLTSKRRKNA